MIGWGKSGSRSSCRGPGQTVDPDELVAWCRDHMANFKVPRSVRVVDSLPLNPTGKVMKFELRAQLNG